MLRVEDLFVTLFGNEKDRSEAMGERSIGECACVWGQSWMVQAIGCILESMNAEWPLREKSCKGNAGFS